MLGAPVRAGPAGGGHRLVHPSGSASVTLVQDQKNPERVAITALAPDRVIANREENQS
jgi:hypothetical protein